MTPLHAGAVPHVMLDSTVLPSPLFLPGFQSLLLSLVSTPPLCSPQSCLGEFPKTQIRSCCVPCLKYSKDHSRLQNRGRTSLKWNRKFFGVCPSSCGLSSCPHHSTPHFPSPLQFAVFHVDLCSLLCTCCCLCLNQAFLLG